MNLEKLQDTKVMHRYILHFYTVTTTDQKEKIMKQPQVTSHQKE